MWHFDGLPTGYVFTGIALLGTTAIGLLVLVSGARRFDAILLWLLGATAGAWLVVDHVHEIAILWVVSAGHGLTVADLAAIPSGLVAAALGVRSLLPIQTTSGRHRWLDWTRGSAIVGDEPSGMKQA